MEDDELRQLVEDGTLGGDSQIIQESGSAWSTVARETSTIGIGSETGSEPAAGPGEYGQPPPPGAYGPQPQGGYGQPPPGAYGAQPQGPYMVPAHGPYGVPVSDKEWLTALLLAIFLGSLGADRFYLGYTGLGFAKLAVTIFTCGIGGVIWAIIDIVAIAQNRLPDSEGRPLRKT